MAIFSLEGPIESNRMDGFLSGILLGCLIFLNDVMFPMILDFSYKNMGIFPEVQ